MQTSASDTNSRSYRPMTTRRSAKAARRRSSGPPSRWSSRPRCLERPRRRPSFALLVLIYLVMPNRTSSRHLAHQRATAARPDHLPRSSTTARRPSNQGGRHELSAERRRLPPIAPARSAVASGRPSSTPKSARSSAAGPSPAARRRRPASPIASCESLPPARRWPSPTEEIAPRLVVI